VPSIDFGIRKSVSTGVPYEELVDTSAPGSDPYILFLGTGSMKPGAFRNVSGIYLGGTDCTMLIDAGEGSYA
jgi:hypothetical protein